MSKNGLKDKVSLERYGWKDKVSFIIYDVTTWLTNNYNTDIDQYLKK